MSSLGTLLWLGYSLNRHKMGPLPLSGVALLVGAMAWVGAWRGWLSLLQAVAVSLVCWALTGIGLWSHWQGYFRFRAEEIPPPRDVSPPLPDERVPLQASGSFEVMHKRRDFVGARAAFSTMDSGEHVIMAHIPRSRFLLLGRWPPEEVGWWYIFLSPQALSSITPGYLLFGPHPQPALEVRYQPERGGERRVHLAFTDQEQRARVWIGLCRGRGENETPADSTAVTHNPPDSRSEAGAC